MYAVALREELMAFSHEPVLLSEVVELAVAHPPRRIVDGTVGGAGHAVALLEAFPDAELLGIDRDPSAIAAASERLAGFGPRARVIQGRLSQMGELMATAGVVAADLVLADLGVSSHQLDTAERGFSFRAAADLDMRMDPTSGVPVRELLADLGVDELTRVIRDWGEERFARRVAHAIVHDLPQTTESLAALVRRVVPKSRDGLDPATRTFQALRMLVNEEQQELQSWLSQVPHILADGGVAVAISFHSLEDRAVKLAFRGAAKGCICPPSLPVCRCGHAPTLKVLTSRGVRAGDAETSRNPRARSASMRAALRLPRGS
jgi:16S rRNA (cytosine1402-N4)-methyltransferase